MTVPDTIQCDGFLLRPWTLEDRHALVRHANNRNVWRNLVLFPHPYTVKDAEQWLRLGIPGRETEVVYAIDVGDPVGTISFHPGDGGFRYCAEIGYWLSEDYWGRGIMTKAVRTLRDLIFEHTEIVRLFAPVFSWNPASMRVLEKAGFEREGVQRRSQFKDGKIIDRVIYAKTRETDLPYEPFGN